MRLDAYPGRTAATLDRTFGHDHSCTLRSRFEFGNKRYVVCEDDDLSGDGQFGQTRRNVAPTHVIKRANRIVQDDR
jgi:hypothetical protein